MQRLVFKRSTSSWQKVGEIFQTVGKEKTLKKPQVYKRDLYAEFGMLNRSPDGKVLHMKSMLKEGGVKIPHMTVSHTSSVPVPLSTLMAPITVLMISFKQYGFNMCNSWHTKINEQNIEQNTDKLEAMPALDNVSILRLNVAEDWYLSWMKKTVLKGVQEHASEYPGAKNVVYFGKNDAIRTALQMHNSFAGYVHLLDKHHRVRWR